MTKNKKNIIALVILLGITILGYLLIYGATLRQDDEDAPLEMKDPPDIKNVHINPDGETHPFASWVNVSCDIYETTSQINAAFLILGSPYMTQEDIPLLHGGNTTYYYNTTYFHPGEYTFTIKVTDIHRRWATYTPQINTFTIELQEIVNDTTPVLSLTNYPTYITPGDTFTVDIAISYNRPYIDGLELHIAEKGPIRLIKTTYHDLALFKKEYYMKFEIPQNATKNKTTIAMAKWGYYKEELYNYPINGTLITLTYKLDENISQYTYVSLNLLESSQIVRYTTDPEVIEYEIKNPIARITIKEIK